MSKCSWINAILALVIIALTLWPTWLPGNGSMWVVSIAALVLLVHSLCCKNCSCDVSGMSKPGKSRRR